MVSRIDENNGKTKKWEKRMETEENLIYLFKSALKWYLDSFSHFQIIVDIFEKILNDFPLQTKNETSY